MAQQEKVKKPSKTSKKVKETKKKVTKKPIKDLTINEKKKNKKSSSNNFTLREVIVIIIITCTIASICTGCIMYFKHRSSNSITYHQLDNDSKLNEFVDIYSEIIENYYDDVDKDAILDAAINAMVGNLGDDYTSYLTEGESNQLNAELSGEYTGIGITVMQNVVINVTEEGPAEEAGIKVDDVIKKVNDLEITEDNFDKLTSEIKNGEDDVVKIVIERDGKELNFEVKRAVLDYPAVSYDTSVENGKKIGYLSIDSFSNTLTRQVKKALEKMESEGIEGLIIDVRGNHGGYLSAATSVSSLFIEKGKILYSLDSKNNKTNYYDETDEHRDYKIVVLMNKGTASSSEILAAALKDSYGATLIGTTSYGKGKVQTKKDLSNGTIVKYTNSRWLRPNGECIDGVGLEPDYEVEIELSSDKTTYIDTQLKKAIEVLTK